MTAPADRGGPGRPAALITRDPFLSELLDREAQRVHHSPALRESLADRGSELCRQLADTPARFTDAKVPVADVACVAALEDLGFRLIDTNVALERGWSPPQHDAAGPAGYEVAFAAPADRGGVARIAGTSFEFSRFHLDPRIPRETAHRIKARWADNYFTGERGDAMVVARCGSETAGFLQLLRADAELVIDLIAVDARHQRRNLASAMIAFAMRGIAGCERMRVGTQVANTGSLRLYEKFGFRVCAASYVLHRHS